MAIYITGDTHGSDALGLYSVDGYIPRLSVKNFPTQKMMNSNDYVIICGDFGGVWDTVKETFGESNQERYGLNWLKKKPFTILFVPGNHENYGRLTGYDQKFLDSWMCSHLSDKRKEELSHGYPQQDWHGGKVRVIRPNVLMLEPGVFDIDGKKVLAIGGAPSHDCRDGILDTTDFSTEAEFKAEWQNWRNQGKEFRVRNISWWDQEVPSPAVFDKVLQEAKAAGHIDFVVSHDVPALQRAVLHMTDDIAPVSAHLDTIRRELHDPEWYCGHVHMNMEQGPCHILYDKITMLNEFERVRWVEMLTGRAMEHIKNIQEIVFPESDQPEA